MAAGGSAFTRPAKAEHNLEKPRARVLRVGDWVNDTPALTPEEPPAVPAAPCAAVPPVLAPAASAQPEDMASAVANTIVVIFMTSVSLFNDKG